MSDIIDSLPVKMTEEQVAKYVKYRSVKAGEELQSRGQKALSHFYVIKGCLRSYVVDEKGKEHTVLFGPEGWLIGDQESFIYGKPASFYIEAIEDSEVAEVNSEGLTEAVMSSEENLRKNNEMLHRRVMAIQRRLISQLSATAEQRYLEFMEIYPGLSRRLPLKLIASYLGITPESLSRVRRDIATRR